MVKFGERVKRLRHDAGTARGKDMGDKSGNK